MIIAKHTIKNNEDYLVKMYASFIYHKIRKPTGELYGIGFYEKKINECIETEWISTNEPASSIARLRNKNECVYCGKKLDVIFGVGDHIVGKKLNSALWLVPCCNICNSSKGNRDLLHWWCVMKNRNILSLQKDVISIYVRAKHKLLKQLNQLNDMPDEEQIKIFNMIWENDS